ncbi:putative VIT family protein [Lyophyllum shimeji]|uniref:VIT family protein n=1 Tax=Lyophyllum shimeji TaxID=47721 RepID=A0A9P3PQ52_LYOSH|nr:putative VIT family protein [Lyophyllum shimeji]
MSSDGSHPPQLASVPLPSRPAAIPQRPSVWPTTLSRGGSNVSLSTKCARTTREDGICCKELKADERTLIDPDVVRDVIIGLSDGLTVPFALTAGLSSLGESKFVILGGVAELIAGAISMGIGGFLASQSERDHYRYLRQQTAARVLRSCDGEMEREVADVLGPVGVDDKTCRAVALCLKEVEEAGRRNGDANGHGDGDANGHAPPDEETASLRWSKDVGITAFLLKFGQGMEEVPDTRLYISAFTIGMGYLVGGLIPLLPYFFIPRAQIALIYSSIVTGIVLLVFGAIKAHVTGAGVGPAGYVWGACSTLLVGGVAAGAAFGIVKAIEG